MRKRLPGKVEYAPELIGHFEMIGNLSLVKQVRESKPNNPDKLLIVNPRKSPKGTKPRLRKTVAVLKRVKVARLHIHSSFSFWSSKFNVPPEIADKMRLGKRYKIQCTVIEIGDEKDVD